MNTTNEKAPGRDPGGFDKTTTNAREFSKAEANIKALFALKGHAVHDGEAGSYIVVRSDWGMSRHCGGFSELVALARQMGVAQ